MFQSFLFSISNSYVYSQCPFAMTSSTSDAVKDRPVQPTRSIHRRRGLPTGRAVVGAFLVTVASVGLFAAYRDAAATPSTTYVVLDHAVAAGQRISAADVHLEPLDLNDQLTATTFTSVASVEGAVATEFLAANHLLTRSEVLLLSPGETAADPPWRELSFVLETSRAVDGTLRPGERIDLLATYDSATSANTVVVFADTPVLRITDASSEVLSTTGAITITIGLSDPELVLATVNAVDEAQALTVVRSTKAPGQQLPASFTFKAEEEPEEEESSS